MKALTVYRLLRSLGMLVREIWLRDRTFRQFVHDHIALLMAVFGFLFMGGLFLNVYFIVQRQEVIIAEHRATEQANKLEIQFLRERVAWYRRRSTDVEVDEFVPSALIQPPDTGPGLSDLAFQDIAPIQEQDTPKKPNPPIPDKPLVHRVPNDDLVERWKRIAH